MILRFGKFLRCALPALLIFAGSAWAGPIGDFEADLRAAYADYRTALFETNRNNKAASETALRNFEGKWRGLTARWGAAPPPHLSEDPQWQASLGKISAIAAEASRETAAGELPRAHETLEAIRGVLGAMRERNGQITFTDRMDTFHEAMEHALQRAGTSLDAAVVEKLRDEAAILSYLASLLRKHQPQATKADTAFDGMLKAVESAVSEFAAATRKSDVPAIKAAAQKLKPAYAKLFLGYG